MTTTPVDNGAERRLFALVALFLTHDYEMYRSAVLDTLPESADDQMLRMVQAAVSLAATALLAVHGGDRDAAIRQARALVTGI